MNNIRVDDDFADDLLLGARAIAGWLFGDPSLRRKIYYLNARSKIPFFKLRCQICCRKSAVKRWVSDEEAKRSGDCAIVMIAKTAVPNKKATQTTAVDDHRHQSGANR